MQLPEKLLLYQETAQVLLDQGSVKEVEFSASTYRILIEEDHRKDWVFLRLNDANEMMDAFCECDCDDVCVHLATAYLFIFHQPPYPLHYYYKQSLWYQLGHIYFDLHGTNPRQLIQIAPGHVEKRSASNKLLFLLEAKTDVCATLIHSLIYKRELETEKNSIKFSGLSEQELQAWKNKTPSRFLEFELSYWGDVSKWLFLSDWKKELHFEFEPRKEAALPSFLLASSSSFKAGFYISAAHLSKLLYPLSRSAHTLPIHVPDASPLHSIVYVPEKAELHLIGASQKELSSLPVPMHPEMGIPLEGWIYVQGEGFFPTRVGELTAGLCLKGEGIEHFLNQNLSLALQLMKNVQVHHEPIPLCHTIAFDADWNLKISAYLFAPGDLTEPSARLFGEWVYLPQGGFYRLEKNQFKELNIKVKRLDVSAFIMKNRSWLNAQKGFITYLCNIESNVSYHVDEMHRLHFNRNVQKKKNVISRDFGSWIYVKGEGFYQKKEAYNYLPIQSGTMIPNDKVSDFIDEYHEELTSVAAFYTNLSPVKAIRFSLSIHEHSQLVIAPDYELHASFKKEHLIFYARYVYILNEGFHRLVFDPKIPSELHHKLIIKEDQLDVFYHQIYPQVLPFLTHIDPRVKPIADLNLIAESFSFLGRGKAELALVYKEKQASCSLRLLCQAMKNKERFVFSDMGAIDLSDHRLAFLHQFSHHRFLKNGSLRLSMIELLKLMAHQNIIGANEEISTHLNELTQFQTPTVPNIEGMNSTLRPYQMMGLQWLWFLYWHHLSGLLCDDMGLGKTHQAMGLMAAILNDVNKQRSVHFLVICPTSVIYHWQDKLKMYFPNMRVCVFYGAKRELQDFQHQDQLLLTSYGIWRNDHKALEEIEFDLAIFDEIHVAKNQSSRIHTTLHKVNAMMRLGLTGTPIENDLLELKALFDLVLPSYMPSQKIFVERFVKPTEGEGASSSRTILANYIKPFVLRRVKEVVLKDLPEKIEEISHCMLSQQQMELYQAVLRSSRSAIEEDLNNEQRNIPYMHIFAILSKLKQICNHPACYLKDAKNYQTYSSGKWDLFVEILTEAFDSGRKIVVFSQYLHMLDIIQCYLEENGIGYASIRGSTVDRSAESKKFENDPDCKVFVASLQAAGVGIDLTAGSVVIHYDRWWNAAKEEQATDRVHRIGQMRGVQVFKMVTRGTFEDRIHELIIQKARLMEEVVGAQEGEVLQSLSRQDLLSLLRDVHEF